LIAKVKIPFHRPLGVGSVLGVSPKQITTTGEFMKWLKERAHLSLLMMAAFVSSSIAMADWAESVPGEYLIKFKRPIGNSERAKFDLSNRLGTEVKTLISGQNIAVIRRPVIETIDHVLKTYGQLTEVKFIEPNYVYRISKTPNDPMLGQLWGMNNGLMSGVDVGALRAWDIQTGSKDTIIAVIDTGVDYNIADLKPNMWTNAAEVNGRTGVDDDGNGVVDDIYGYNASNNTGDPRDDHGHGSHCAGTIGAKGDDGAGVVGVNWNTRIMAVKFLDASGGGTLEGAVLAIDYATKMGAKIMSNSWGGGGASEALKEAIERSNRAGALFIAAAGNDSSDNDTYPTYPASYAVNNIVAVAAIDDHGAMAYFSNYGKNTVHVGAPGVNILSTTPSGFQTMSGTSMATPHVSGIAGLLASNEPGLSNMELKNRLVTTAQPIAGLRGKVRSGGLANAYLALTNTIPQPDPNDPANWQTKNLSVQSAHPYVNAANETYEVNVPGVREFALYFSKFETEKNYDFVEVYDRAGTLLFKMSGNNTDSFSQVVTGNYAKIIFKSDDSVAGWGFQITKAAYR
jgi:thermitase